MTAPKLADSVPVNVAKDVSYISNPNRLQNLSIYLAVTEETSRLVDKPVTTIPSFGTVRNHLPRRHVHVHGGAWRDPNLGSSSIEAAVAHAFVDYHPETSLIDAIISINYTLSPFPTHPTRPYDPVKDAHFDPAREAKHPAHIHDVLHAFSLLRSLGLNDGSYILSGHSCGACLAFQAALQSASYWDLQNISDIPRPAALLGLNGLYDLPRLVDALGATHAQLKDVYEDLQSIAFGADRAVWEAASPARVDPDQLATRVQQGTAASVVVVDQSTGDQLVPMNQMDVMKVRLESVPGLMVVKGKRAVGVHAAPWEQGDIIWETIKDALDILARRGA